ncbi:MAG: Gfo/Idh/MocA family oxidoreductase [Methanobacteriota archaeon]|nr:MAG: Gfo/Idh/MocA family oxidoreductase [Euryarchaeota archaeon]
MNVGVIGVGSMGRNHARILSEMGLLGGVADTAPGVAKAIGKRFSVKHFLSYRELLRRDFDAVTVVTPTTTHSRIATEALKLGKHVLLEKPMTGDPKKLAALESLARRQKVVLAGGFTERHNPAVDFARRSIKSKAYGELITAATRRVSSMPTRIRDVGVVMDLGIHDIDVLQHIVAKPPRSVYALGGKSAGTKYEDHANILIDFEGGETGFIEVNWLTPMKVRKLSLTCSKNYVEVDYMDQSALVCSSSFKQLETGNLYEVPIEFDLRRIALRKEEPLKREIGDFLGAIDNGVDPLVTGESALTTLKVAYAALRSMRTGGKQAVR